MSAGNRAISGASAHVAVFNLLRRAGRRIVTSTIAGPLLGLVVLVIVFGVWSPVFLTPRNISQIAQQVMEVGTLAIGQTMIIMTAGIDLANGAIMVLGSVVMAKLATETGVSPAVAIVGGLAVTTALASVSGGLAVGLRLPPFIVTLGMLNIVTAVTLLHTHGTQIQGLPPALIALGNSVQIGSAAIPIGPLIMLGVVAIVWYLMSQTAWGRHLRAIGSSEETARVAGIKTGRHLISVYALAGLIYGVAALMVLGRTAVGDPQAGATDNLDSIAAVVIGGTSLFGGRGTVIGTLIGAIVIGVIANGLTLVGIDALWQYVATGTIVITAVALDQTMRRRKHR